MEPSNEANSNKALSNKRIFIDTKPSMIKQISDIEEISEEISRTEIAAEITVPQEGGWGWVVVIASFLCIFILDGTFFTFASIYKDMAKDFSVDISLVALVNSVAIALYFITGPIVSALINRYGFRSCTMTGSVIVSFSYCLSHYADDYVLLLLFYGIIPGFGGCFIYMSSQLVVGFYFERLRALAMALAGLGQSFGITIMSIVNTHLVTLAGWRMTTLIHSGMFGTIYFLGMIYRPLVSVTITRNVEEPGTVISTYLPSLSNMKMDTGQANPLSIQPSKVERLFSAVSNVHFPTVAEVIEEEEEDKIEEKKEERKDDQGAGPSWAHTSKLTITTHHPEKWISERHLRIVKSFMDAKDELNKLDIKVSTRNIPAAPNRPWWRKCCHWEEHVPESRPMYRDDAFYDGRLEKLAVYQKSMMDTTREAKTGLEYNLAVSRAVTTQDLKERKGVFTTAVRRILATMMDPKLLRRCSFLMVCTTGFLTHVGLLVPYIFLPDRNKNEGIDQSDCNRFVSVIGVSNVVGRLFAGIVACKFNPIKMYSIGCLLAGTGTVASSFCFDVYYQYFCCVIFGFAVAQISTLRSLVIVDLYGLDNLTNATGILLMFQGFGILLSTPLSGVLTNYFGYIVSFSVAGMFMIAGGIVISRVKKVARNEEKRKFKLAKKRSTIVRKKSKKELVLPSALKK